MINSWDNCDLKRLTTTKGHTTTYYETYFWTPVFSLWNKLVNYVKFAEGEDIFWKVIKIYLLKLAYLQFIHKQVYLFIKCDCTMEELKMNETQYGFVLGVVYYICDVKIN